MSGLEPVYGHDDHEDQDGTVPRETEQEFSSQENLTDTNTDYEETMDEVHATETDDLTTQELLFEIKSDLESVKEELSTLGADEAQQEIFQKLYSDLEAHRRDFMFKYILKPFFKDVIGLYDRVEQMVDYFSVTNADMDVYVANLESVRKEILNILRHQDVTAIEMDDSGFDDRYQEAIDTETVEDSDADQTVLSTVRRGFMYGDKLIRPEEVKVAKYEPQGADLND